MQDRVQLDRVRRDARRLAVGEVEQGDPGDAGLSAEPDVAPVAEDLDDTGSASRRRTSRSPCRR
jgi:hypothetical protein